MKFALTSILTLSVHHLYLREWGKWFISENNNDFSESGQDNNVAKLYKNN